MTTINVNRRESARQAYKAVKSIVVAVVIIVAALILFGMSSFTVGEAEQAVVLRFGVINRVILDPDIRFLDDNQDLVSKISSEQNIDIVYKKGLFLKIPFVDQVKKYDSRLLTYVSQDETINTSDKKQYSVTMFAQWRIANPALFYQVYQSVSRATQVLDNTIYPILIQRINNLAADDFLSNKDMLNESLKGSLGEMNAAMRDGGIEVVDVQVNRTLLPQANLQSTYDRMVANRQKVAQQLRSEGLEAYEKAVAEADLEASKLIADATKQSKEIKGQADAEALTIYAESYSADPSFYGYWRSLKAMELALGHDATIVLDRQSPLWKDMLDLVDQGKISTVPAE